jgi:hypothetical protein
LGLLLLLAGCSSPALEGPQEGVTRVPQLLIDGAESSPEHAARIERIDRRRLITAMSLLGLEDPGGEILLVLATEETLAAKSAPQWISGYALSDRSVAVLFPARTPSYPDSTFEELVLHEVGHILVFRAVGSGEIPRWFNEGLALFIGRPWDLEDHSRVTWALVSGRKVSLTELEPYFNSSREAARHAYALAGAFVQDLVKREGGNTVGRILAAVSQGIRFDDAYREITGEDLAQAEDDFWSRHTFLYRWVPVIGSSATLWTLITVLALLAFRRRRARDAELHRLWEQEGLPPSDDTPPRN